MADKADILVLVEQRPKAMAQLEARYRLHRHDLANDKDAFVAACAPRIRGVVSNGEVGANRALLAQLPALEIVACFGVGVDAIDLAYCQEQSVPVTNTPDVLSAEVADLGLGLTLAVMKRVFEADRYLRAGNWPKSGPFAMGTTLGGKTMGIVGLGRIGKALAKRAEACDMSIVYHGRNAQADVPYRYYADLVAMARDVDVLAISTPGGDGTRGLVSAEVLRALGPEGYLVNIARGSVVDEAALTTALVNREIKGAGLDVFEREPNVPEALIGLDHVILTPHIASATNETRDAMAQLVVDNLDAHFAGKPLPTRFI
ncbi:MAG: 2-hydroxyacid dehydrogenase [Pseudomonadota bacterium]